MASGSSQIIPISPTKLPNYFTVTADMTSATWNTIASHEIATTTGLVHYIVIPECTATLTDAADGASIQLGIEGATTALIASTGAAGAGANTIATGEFWQSDRVRDLYPDAPGRWQGAVLLVH